MVEINNQRKAFLDMLKKRRGRRELITDVRKPEAMSLPDVILAGGELFTDYSDHPRKPTSAVKNSNQQAPDATNLSRWWDAYRKQLGLKDFSPKRSGSGRCGVAAD